MKMKSGRVKDAFIIKYKMGEFVNSIPPYSYYCENKKLYIRKNDTP